MTRNGDVRGAEEVVVLQRLLAIGGLVATHDAKRVVELEAALAAAFEIDPEIFARRRKIMVVACARSGLGVDRFTEAFLGFATCDQHLPRLAVAPGGRALRHGENVLDGLAGDLLRQEGANGIAFVQQLFEHADAILGRVMRLWGSIHVHRPLVGILLNGTSLSTRMSPGSPSTRSAMMLRRISSVPPAMRIDGELSSICW